MDGLQYVSCIFINLFMSIINVLSLGAGKQSSYMLLNSLKNGIKPDLAIFSDTKCEPNYVYDYLKWLVDYCKIEYKFQITIVSEGNLMEDVIDYQKGNKKRVASLPLFTETGIINRQCTNDYKIRPLRKYLQKVRNGNKVKLWLGISLDEIERMKQSNVQYITNEFPLIHQRIKIDNIKAWFFNNKLPEPSKSACLVCPFHSNQYWQIFKVKYPQEFETACNFDDIIRNYGNMKQKCYLNRQLKPLREIDFKIENSLFPELIEECNGLCGL